jgi:prepilin-type N-terminal cleavage/methylation domain-containing protein
MNKNGFTIIELLVVIAIMTGFFIVVISNFSQIRFRFALSRTAYKFNQDLRRAQNMALSFSLYKDSEGTEAPVDGYGIHIDLDILGNKKYIIYADKQAGNQQYDSSDYIIEEIDLKLSEPGIIIKEINNVAGNKVSVNFSELRVEISQLISDQSNMDVVFAVESDQSIISTVSVNTAGLIETK